MDQTLDGKEQVGSERCLKVRVIDDGLRLVPYYPDEEVALQWYRDPEVVKQVDNSDRLYTPERLKEMYAFLSENGDCYYAEYRGKLAGDVTLRDNGEICIVIAKEYQNRNIGRRCIREMIALAKEKGFPAVRANIYSFNAQSQRAFLSTGFVQTAEEWYEYAITR